MTGPEYEEAWEQCVELCLVDRDAAQVRAVELAHMRAPEGETWAIPVAACLIFGHEIGAAQ